MPKKLERKLKKEARKKFPGDREKQNTYVYGTINKLKLSRKSHDDEHEFRE